MVADLEQDDEMIQVKIFGPVMTVQPFDDEDNAIAWERTKYGLEPRFGRATSVGRIGWRRAAIWLRGSATTSRWSPRCRMAGYKQLGYGKDLSMYPVEDYTNIKHVMLNAS